MSSFPGNAETLSAPTKHVEAHSQLDIFQLNAQHKKETATEIGLFLSKQNNYIMCLSEPHMSKYNILQM